MIGRENIPDGAVMICCNHTSDSDPLFLCYAFRLKHQIRAMAKIELIRIPVIGWLLSKAGIFGVDRGKSDIGAIKQAMKYLREGEKVLIFPEEPGPLQPGRREPAQGGCRHAGSAVRRSHPAGLRAGAQALVPPHAVVIGEAFTPTVATRKGTQEEYEAITADLMARIRALEAQAR